MWNESGVNPTGIRVIVRPPKLEEKTSGGIILPEMTQEKEEKAQMTGVVIAIAENAKIAQEMKGIKVGDTVFFAKYAGANADWHHKGVLYRVMNATDIIGKVDSEMDSQFRAAKSSVEAFPNADVHSQAA